MDDLGSGYSSLNLLHRLRPDFVKLDMQLIRGVHADPYKATMASRLLGLARDLGVLSVAEGVETPEELEWVREHGADYVQGYLVARPGNPPRLGAALTTTPGAGRPRYKVSSSQPTWILRPTVGRMATLALLLALGLLLLPAASEPASAVTVRAQAARVAPGTTLPCHRASPRPASCRPRCWSLGNSGAATAKPVPRGSTQPSRTTTRSSSPGTQHPLPVEGHPRHTPPNPATSW